MTKLKLLIEIEVASHHEEADPRKWALLKNEKLLGTFLTFALQSEVVAAELKGSKTVFVENRHGETDSYVGSIGVLLGSMEIWGKQKN